MIFWNDAVTQLLSSENPIGVLTKHKYIFMAQGKVKFFDTKKGFGFIKPDDGGKDVFVHRNNVENLDQNQGLEDGESVEYEVEETPKGLSAVNVRSLDYV